MLSSLNDLKFGLRMMAKSLGFTIVAVLTLALGIGANTAILSVVKAVLLRSFPFKNADRLVTVYEEIEGRGTEPVTIDILAALALSRLIGTLLFGVASTDPLTFAVVGIVILGATITASYIPARRAMRVDSIVALRYE